MKIYTIDKTRKSFPEQGIEKGDTYYYCQPKSLRKTKQQKKRFKNIEDLKLWIKGYTNSFRGEFSTNIENWTTSLETVCFDEEQKSELIEEIENFLNEKFDSLSNIPSQLQESHVLNEQIETIEELLEQANNIEIEDED